MNKHNRVTFCSRKIGHAVLAAQSFGARFAVGIVSASHVDLSSAATCRESAEGDAMPIFGWGHAGLPPLSAGYVSVVTLSLLTPMSVYTTNWGFFWRFARTGANFSWRSLWL